MLATSVLMMLLAGYAVVDNPTIAIVGEGDAEPNDTYREQLIAGAEAAVAVVVELGVADPERLLIGGHTGTARGRASATCCGR